MDFTQCNKKISCCCRKKKDIHNWNCGFKKLSTMTIYYILFLISFWDCCCCALPLFSFVCHWTSYDVLIDRLLWFLLRCCWWRQCGGMPIEYGKVTRLNIHNHFNDDENISIHNSNDRLCSIHFLYVRNSWFAYYQLQ